MISFAPTENCVKWHMDTCLSVQNKQKNGETFGVVYNVHPGKTVFGLWETGMGDSLAEYGKPPAAWLPQAALDYRWNRGLIF